MFSFGMNKSKSSSSSSSFGSSQQGSSSLSDSLGTSRSRAGSSASSFTDIAFEDLFAELYGGAAGAAGRVAELAPGFSQQAAALFSGGLDFLGSLGGGAAEEHLAARMDGSSPVLNEQIGALQEDMGRLFREELNPAITSRAVAGGTLGGGRQGVSQGRASDAVAREFSRGVTQLRSADMANRDAAARDLLASRNQGAGIGLSALPGLLGIAEGGFGAEMAPYSMLAQIMGGPTTLAGSSSSSFSESDAMDVARAIAESFGTSFEQSSSRSSSKSGGFNIGFGGS